MASEKNSGARDLHAEREQAQRDGDSAKVADLDRQIAEQNPSQPDTGSQQ